MANHRLSQRELSSDTLPDNSRTSSRTSNAAQPMGDASQANTRPALPVPTGARREQLRDDLLATVEHLKARRADLIGDDVIAEYVSLDWLEWQGGGLKLTVTGTNVCRQAARMRPVIGPVD